MFILVKYYMTKNRYCRNSSGASYLVVISAVSACSPILFEKRSFTCIFKNYSVLELSYFDHEDNDKY